MDGFSPGAVVVVVVGTLLVAVLFFIWRHIRKWISRLWTVIRSFPSERTKARHDAKLSSIREDVRERSNDLDIDLPWSRDPKWTGPGVRIIYRSGIDRFFVDPYEGGIGQYEAGLRSGALPPDRTSRQAAPRVVERWSLEVLEVWLLEHPIPKE
jgi:hypothetical protein